MLWILNFAARGPCRCWPYGVRVRLEPRAGTTSSLIREHRFACRVAGERERERTREREREREREKIVSLAVLLVGSLY